MASSTNSNFSANNFVGPELSIIASSFVKQYYTLLNKAPHYICNFYSNDSTFIHGTIEAANEHHIEPIVGREKIRRKVEDLKLNDSRAKIKQIDCLETLAGGLVIQVIGELSNNGRPMRRFLQTFILAPSPDDGRTDGDSQGPPKSSGGSGTTDRRGIQISDSNTSSSQKFFVLNSIFRYHDDGPENEFENDIASVHATASSEVASGEKVPAKEPIAKPALDHAHADGSQGGLGSGVAVANTANTSSVGHGHHIQNVRGPIDTNTKDAAPVDRATRDFERGAKINPSPASIDQQELKQPDSVTSKTVVVNGTSKAIDKKSETSEKPIENGNAVDSNNQNLSGSLASTSATTARTQPSNEPKTWAKAVSNNPPTSANQANTSKPLVSEQPQNSNQLSSQAHQQQPPQVSSQNNINNNNNLGNNNNNRRRHMMRKPANKTTGRSIKNRPPRPPAQPHQQSSSQHGKPAA